MLSWYLNIIGQKRPSDSRAHAIGFEIGPVQCSNIF